MKIGKIEKLLVNSEWNKKRRLQSAQKLLSFAGLEGEPDCLEIGCGNGVISKHFAQKYHSEVIGTDVDPEQIELAQEGIKEILNIRFLVADATSLPFEDNRFDVVMSFQVMHHISNWLDAMAEVRRVLKPGGYFIYDDLIYPELLAKLGRFLANRVRMNMYGITTLQDLASFIEKNGFSTLNASSKGGLLGYRFEAVYQRN
jgi:ubiquinone/menaquinone biosynthesis C-methylase UbiE